MKGRLTRVLLLLLISERISLAHQRGQMEKNLSTYLDDDDDSVLHLDIHLKRLVCINEHEHLSEQIETKRKLFTWQEEERLDNDLTHRHHSE